MLASLNLYCYGYIATPIIEACQKHGLFESLDKNNFRTRQWLIKKLNANAGYFTLALQVLESLGRIEKNSEDAYRITNQANSDGFNLNLSEFYAIEAQQLIQHKIYARQFSAIIDKAFLDDQLESRILVTPEQGAIIVLLIFIFQELKGDNFNNRLDQLDVKLAQSIEKLFIQQQWLTANTAELTVVGKQLLEGSIFKRAASYKLILAVMDKLLFGDHAHVFEKKQGFEKTTWDRNIIADCFSHESYFSDLQQEIIHIFNQQPVTQQPQAVINIGCDSGLLLKEIYQIICNRTARAQHLAQLPVQLFGIDDNQQSLEQTAKTLAGLNCRTFLGDINQPGQLKYILEQNGLTSDQQILHVRTFLDHHIAVDANQPINDSLAILAVDQPAFYLDQKGQLLSNLAVLSRWQQHLDAWAKSLHKSQLIILEAHPLPSQLGFQQLTSSEGLHFDSILGLSNQYLISAEAFIILAASVGLFNQNSVKRYPKNADFCWATLHCFTKRDYIVRHAADKDLESLYQLEKLCWQHTCTSEQQILERVRKYPQGQFVLEKENKILGVIYSQRIASTEALEKCSAANVHELHQVSGSIIQLLAVNIHPQAQNLNLGDQLLEFMLQRCSVMNGIDTVVGVTLCKDYKTDSSLTFQEYIQKRDEHGKIQDPVLSFHETHGAKVVKEIAGYRPQDLANECYGVLVQYDIQNRISQIKESTALKQNDLVVQKKSPVLKAISKINIEIFLTEIIQAALQEDKECFAIDRPLMEMGLDSANLLKLVGQIQTEYAIVLEPAFFFQYNTAQKVLDFLVKTLNVVTVQPSSPSFSQKIKSVSPKHNTSHKSEPKNSLSKEIAIVGISCRLPGGVNTLDDLWSLLAEGRSGISSLPEGRFSWPDEVTTKTHPGIEQGGFLHDISSFDAPFFRISPKEAESMDPQQRMLLELSWQCLEDSGTLPHSSQDAVTGVFIGASGSDYSKLLQEADVTVEAHNGTGNSMAVLANRISYFFDFSGPSLQIDTACSSSLIAVHAAMQSLRNGECDQALVGGIHLICHASNSLAYYKAGMLAKDGRCKVFDASANGYVRSEGAIMFLLKPLEQAIQNKDPIRAILKGSAINHGGLSGGLTVPNPQKQTELLQQAWESAGIDPDDLTYLEAHGTGTSLGDPLEIQGMKQAFVSSGRTVFSEKFCGVGSLKSNLGHLEAAAGIAGVLKVILAMQYRQLPASINLQKLNPEIQLDTSPLFIVNENRPWVVAGEQKRIAGVSSFGSGGANAHVVLEEWTQVEKPDIQQESYLFIVSAKNKDQLVAYVESILSWITLSSRYVAFADFIYTFQVSRTFMDERLAIQASDFSQLRDQLTQWVKTKATSDTSWQENAKQAFEKFGSLLQGNAGVQILTAALAEKNLKQLSLLWMSGCNIDFGSLYEELPCRIPAPSYPFAGPKYWIKPRVEKNAAHFLLGNQIPSLHGVVFSQVLNNLSNGLFFTQDNFSCLSLGFILEIFLSAGRKISPTLAITSIDQFRYFPFYLEQESPIIYETRCFHQGNKLSVELVQIVGAEQVLIAEAELTYSSNNTNEFIVDISQTATKWISLEEKEHKSYSLPIETLKAIFPALLHKTLSPSIVIPKIMFYEHAASESLLVALNPGEISILNHVKQPILSIHQSAH